MSWLIDNENGANASASVKDPVQQFVRDVTKETDQRIQNLYAKQEELRKAADVLCEMSVEHRNYVAEMLDLLKDLGKMMVLADNENSDHHEGFAAVRHYISIIKSNVNKVTNNCKNIECELRNCKKMVLEYEKERRKKDERITFLENLHTLMETRKAKDQKVMQNMEVANKQKIEYMANVHRKEVEALKKELAEKDQRMKQMQEEIDKSAKMQKLKRLNEERVMSRKELEDLEDKVSREIKTLQMRKLFVKSIRDKVKSAMPEDDNQREVIERSLNTSMQTVNTLKVERGRIMKIVQQKDASR